MTADGESGVLDRNMLGGPLPSVGNDSLSWSRSVSIDAGRDPDLGRPIKRPFNAERLVGEAGGFTAVFKECTDRDENDFSVTEMDVAGLVTEVMIP